MSYDMSTTPMEDYGIQDPLSIDYDSDIKGTIIGFLYKNKDFMPDIAKLIHKKALQQNGESHARKVLFSKMDSIIVNILESKDWQKNAEKYSSLEKITSLILASANRDPDTTWTFSKKSRTWNSKDCYLSTDQLMVLSDSKKLNKITESHFKELIHFCAIGKFKDENVLSNFISKNARYLTRDNSNIYQKIENNLSVIDDDVVLFLSHNISLVYLESYRNLNEDYKKEFWHWNDLRNIASIRNPAKIFFNFYDNIICGVYSFKDLVNKRKFIENSGAFSEGVSARKFDYQDELDNINLEAINFYHGDFYPKERANSHHIFFPDSRYHNGEMASFRGKFKIKILINAHNRIHAKISNLQKYHNYKIPIPNDRLQDTILSDFEQQEYEYLNFLELKRIVCLFCMEMIERYSEPYLSFNEDFINAQDVYKFLKIQSEFITPRTSSIV